MLRPALASALPSDEEAPADDAAAQPDGAKDPEATASPDGVSEDAAAAWIGSNSTVGQASNKQRNPFAWAGSDLAALLHREAAREMGTAVPLETDAVPQEETEGTTEARGGAENPQAAISDEAQPALSTDASPVTSPASEFEAFETVCATASRLPGDAAKARRGAGKSDAADIVRAAKESESERKDESHDAAQFAAAMFAPVVAETASALPQESHPKLAAEGGSAADGEKVSVPPSGADGVAPQSVMEGNGQGIGERVESAGAASANVRAFEGTVRLPTTTDGSRSSVTPGGPSAEAGNKASQNRGANATALSTETLSAVNTEHPGQPANKETDKSSSSATIEGTPGVSGTEAGEKISDEPPATFHSETRPKEKSQNGVPQRDSAKTDSTKEPQAEASSIAPKPAERGSVTSGVVTAAADARPAQQPETRPLPQNHAAKAALPESPGAGAVHSEWDSAPRTVAAQELKLQVQGANAERVQLEVRERNGDVLVSVRSRNEVVADALRSDLGDLARRFSAQGVHAEFRAPQMTRTEKISSSLANTDSHSGGSDRGADSTGGEKHGSNSGKRDQYELWEEIALS